MHDAAAAWLMTLLAPSPLLVSLVQAATTLPLFLLALPAGALADIFDRRRILLIAQVWWFLTTAVLGVLTITGVIQPWMLLVITLAIVAGGPGPVFFINAVSVLGVFFVLWRWRRKPVRATLPAERLASAMRAGVRYVRFAPALRTVVVRTAAFVGFANALWALLPLVVKVSLSRGPVSYGALVGSLDRKSVV